MRHALLFVCLLGLCVPVAGCGGDSGSTSVRGAGGGRTSSTKKPKPKKGAEAAAAGADLSKLPPKLRDVDWKAQDDLAQSMRETRDPFAPYVEDLIERESEGDGENSVTKIESTISDTPVEALKLIAIITGGAVHKAMVTDNRGLGHIVRPGDIVGAEPPMRLVRITRNEVLFRALEVGPDEEKPKEVRKVLLSQEELQELLP